MTAKSVPTVYFRGQLMPLVSVYHHSGKDEWMRRFKTGDIVELNGLLAELRGDTRATVVSVIQDKDGISGLDEYEIVFTDSTRLRVWGFQLTLGVKEVRKKMAKRINRHVTPHRAWTYLHVHSEMSLADHEHVLHCEGCLRLFQICLKSEDFRDVLKYLKPNRHKNYSPQGVPTQRSKSILN